MCSFLSFPLETSCWTGGSKRQTQNKDLRDTETKLRDVRQSDREMQEGKSWDYRQGAGRKSQPGNVSVRDTTAQRNAGRETQREREIKQLRRERLKEVQKWTEIQAERQRQNEAKKEIKTS